MDTASQQYNYAMQEASARIKIEIDLEKGSREFGRELTNGTSSYAIQIGHQKRHSLNDPEQIKDLCKPIMPLTSRHGDRPNPGQKMNGSFNTA